jgi:hypothetical protein
MQRDSSRGRIRSGEAASVFAGFSAARAGRSMPSVKTQAPDSDHRIVRASWKTTSVVPAADEKGYFAGSRFGIIRECPDVHVIAGDATFSA